MHTCSCEPKWGCVNTRRGRRSEGASIPHKREPNWKHMCCTVQPLRMVVVVVMMVCVCVCTGKQEGGVTIVNEGVADGREGEVLVVGRA